MEDPAITLMRANRLKRLATVDPETIRMTAGFALKINSQEIIERKLNMLARSFLFLLMGSSVFAHASFAADFQAWGRSYVHSCGYYSSKTGEVHVTVKDRSVSYGAKVSLIYGWGGTTHGYQGSTPVVLPLAWQNRGEVEMIATDQFTWKAEITETIAQRGGNQFLNSLQYVVKITDASGERYAPVDGYLQSSLVYSSQCVDSSTPRPEMSRLDIQFVPR
jgi:hypothetical protein